MNNLSLLSRLLPVQTELRSSGLRQASRLSLLLLLLLSAAVMRGADAETTSPQAEVEPLTGPEQLKTNVHIRVVTNAPSAKILPDVAAAKGSSFNWDFSWRGWDGLHVEVSESTPLTNDLWAILGLGSFGSNALPGLVLDKVKMSGNLGARIEMDGAGFLTTGDLTGFDGGAQLRRALISARGDCILVFPVSYLIQLGYIPNEFYINQAFLLFENINYLGNLQFGVFTPPMGLQLITSSRDISLMEPAAPLQAIGPGNEAGIQIGRPVFKQRATWALGIFGEGPANSEYGNASQNYGNAIGRLTWLALDHRNPDHPAANRYLHVGVSANYQYSGNSTVRYQSRPESYIAPYVIDTGDIDASGATTVAVEAAWVNGPWSVQGELIHSSVHVNDGSHLDFGGFYAEASWYLTGESRRYDPVAGDFMRLVPRHDFTFGEGGGWGALELACRFSHTDLTDGSVQGGRLDLLMTGVNWYLNPHVKWMFNYGMGRVSGGQADGDLFIFQTRVGVDF